MVRICRARMGKARPNNHRNNMVHSFTLYEILDSLPQKATNPQKHSRNMLAGPLRDTLRIRHNRHNKNGIQPAFHSRRIFLISTPTDHLRSRGLHA